MDNRRFDSLVKSLAGGASRRSLLKGFIGLGASAAVGGTLLESGADAARRPTPTPKPVKCPGQQTPVDGVCTCPGTAPIECGPECCNPGGSGAAHSECCDNSCCFGACYGEELCCPTNPPAGGGAPSHKMCTSPNGKRCIPNTEGACCANADCPNGYVCTDNSCVSTCNGTLTVLLASHGTSDQTGACPPSTGYVTGEIGLYRYLNGSCGDVLIATSSTNGSTPASFSNLGPGAYCALPTDPNLRGCLDCPDTGSGAGANILMGCNGEQRITFGANDCCLGSVTVPVFVHVPPTDSCSQGPALEGVEVAIYDCATLEELYGPATSGSDGYAYIPGVPPGSYCVRATSGSGYRGCGGCPQFSTFSFACPNTPYPALSICDASSTCDLGHCVPTDPCGDQCTSDQVCIDEDCLCQAGFSTKDDGCEVCPAGYYSDLPGQSSCAPCDLNTYQPSAGMTSCLSCPDGAYTEHVGQTTCQECDCTQGSMPLICGCTSACDPGYGPENGQCVSCDPGSQSPDGNACTPCQMGYFASSSATTLCEPCYAGTYAALTGTATCQDCPAGTYADFSGSASCKACDCGPTCDRVTGKCPGSVGVGGACEENSDCTSDVCGCGSPPNLPECMCRFDTCWSPGTDCSSGFGAISCCSGDCRCTDDGSGLVCLCIAP